MESSDATTVRRRFGAARIEVEVEDACDRLGLIGPEREQVIRDHRAIGAALFIETMLSVCKSGIAPPIPLPDEPEWRGL